MSTVYRTEDGCLMVPEGPSRREDQAYDAETGKPVERQLTRSVDKPGMFLFGMGYAQFRVTREWLEDFEKQSREVRRHG